MIIIFEMDSGVCTLTKGIDNGLTLLETGQRDVPAGIQFWIVDPSELPLDEPTESWELDVAALGEPAGVGGTYVEKSEEEHE
ncbi:hypothetical protein M989_02146 [Kluyvera georgiana ATCC 51603]|uniref:Uncharacterized protein n=1 Tax=Kluyvera georgiana ATCC 51603 TaxID=1354264 RepID=A0A1B7JZ09_9ENTR|nr:hypothetical protein [Kluyvera georgiana]OAT53138.1 hypothetical protein M989_02146 [Kluyvera georgiana ATCC 51603]